jgi:hypothetical protein
MQIKAKAGDGPVLIEFRISVSDGVAIEVMYEVYDISPPGGTAHSTKVPHTSPTTFTLPDAGQYTQTPYLAAVQPVFGAATQALVEMRATQNGQPLPDIDSPGTMPWHPLETITKVGGDGAIYPQGFSVFYA